MSTIVKLWLGFCLLLVLVFFAVDGHAQNARFDGVVLSRSGLPAPGATVALCTQPAVTTTTPCTPAAALCSSVSDLVCTSPNPVTADGLGNYFFYVKNGICTVSAPCTLQFYGSAVTTRIQADQSFGGATTAPGISCSPITANGVVYINNSSACVTSNTATFTSSTNTLVVGANGGSAVGTVKANGTSSSNGATLSTNAAGSQILLGANFTGSPWSIVGDTALNPVNYVELQSASGSSAGFEWVGQGDVSGLGSAAGFKVSNAASTNGSSPGASNSFSAGSANGNDAISPGGDTTFSSGSSLAGNSRGGDVTFNGGNGHGTGRGGNINLNPGSTGSGAIGAVVLGNVTGTTQCLQASSTGAISGSGGPCPITSSSSTTTATGVAIGASNTVAITKAITFPPTGCPCRARISYDVFFAATASGVVSFWVSDGTNQFATSQVLTNTAGGGNNSAGAFASSDTPVSYSNGQVITFTVNGNTNSAGGITTGSSALGTTQASYLNITVFSSN